MQLLTMDGYAPLALSVQADVVHVTFAGTPQVIEVETPRPAGTTDSKVTSAIITLATKHGIKPSRRVT